MSVQGIIITGAVFVGVTSSLPSGQKLHETKDAASASTFQDKGLTRCPFTPIPSPPGLALISHGCFRVRELISCPYVHSDIRQTFLSTYYVLGTM